MERRDRIVQYRQQAAGSAVPRAIGGAVDERDIIEMMERRSMAEASAVDDVNNAQTSNTEGSSGSQVESAALGLIGVADGAGDTAAAEDDTAAAGGSASSEGSFSGSEEEDSEGSWSSQDEEGGDSDIEEFYLKGGEGQMDEVAKKKKNAAEQKLVMVHPLRCHAPAPADAVFQVQLEKERQMKKNLIMLPCAAPVKPRCEE